MRAQEPVDMRLLASNLMPITSSGELLWYRAHRLALPPPDVYASRRRPAPPPLPCPPCFSRLHPLRTPSSDN